MTRSPQKPCARSLIALAIFASLPLLAQSQDSGWYAGGGLGRASATIDDPRIVNGLLGAGLATTSIEDHDRSNGGKLFGGYQLNRFLAIEAGYFDLGHYGFIATTLPPGTLNGTIKLRGLNLDAVGTLPLGEKLSVFGRIGAASTRASDTFMGTGAVGVTTLNARKRDTLLKLGVGMQYELTNALSMRLEAERYRVNDAIGNKGHVDLVSVGLIYRFGGPITQIPPRAMAAPEPAAYTPPPAVVAAAPMATTSPARPAPTPPPMPQQVSFSADSLFDFDRSDIRPAGQQALDSLAGQLRSTRYDKVQVTGHTDRLGAHVYNEKLSIRRAQAVGAYLVNQGAVPAGKIATHGMGSAQPVTQVGECQGQRTTPRLVACLQPDRRVDVEVTGSR